MDEFGRPEVIPFSQPKKRGFAAASRNGTSYAVERNGSGWYVVQVTISPDRISRRRVVVVTNEPEAEALARRLTEESRGSPLG